MTIAADHVCANGGRDAYNPCCRIVIEFEGSEHLWVYPLALNGRKIKSVTIGGVEYGPSDIDEQWITEMVGGRLTVVAVEMGDIRFEPASWVPVERRLPGDGEMVLVSCETKKGAKTVNRAYRSRSTWHGSGSMSGVKAWMPLPEPYEEEEE